MPSPKINKTQGKCQATKPNINKTLAKCTPAEPNINNTLTTIKEDPGSM
jgi:hypothetical protein